MLLLEEIGVPEENLSRFCRVELEAFFLQATEAKLSETTKVCPHYLLQYLRFRCFVRLPFIPPYHKIQVDLLLFSNFEGTDSEQTTVDHDVSIFTSVHNI